MGDVRAVWRHTKMVVLVALTAALYAALLVPFKSIPIIPGITELRPANVVPIVCSLLFGPAAAWGSAIGNLIGDFFGTLGPGSLFGFAGNFLLGYLPYQLWRLLAPGQVPSGRPGLWLVFFEVCLIPAVACGVVIAWGVDLLGLVPFKVLAPFITINNTLAAFVLGAILLPLLYPRAERWRLVYWEIMPAEELTLGAGAWPAAAVITGVSLGAVGWAAWLAFGGSTAAAGPSVRVIASAAAVAVLVATALLAGPAKAGVEGSAAIPLLPKRTDALAVEVVGLTFTYRGAPRPALAEVNLVQRGGELRCVMGETGAGKTTLCLALAGVVPWLEPGEWRGEVRLFGTKISGLPPRALAGRLGLVLQDFETQLLGSQVESAVAFALENLGLPPAVIAERVDAALAALGIVHLRARDPNSLSGGEKQRAALAAVLALQPEVVVLDEPTTDLDGVGRAQVVEAWQRLRAAGHTLLITEHEAELAAHADVITVLKGGHVVFDGAAEALWADPRRCLELGVRPPEAAEIAAALQLPPLATAEALARQLAQAQARLAAPQALPPAASDWPTPGEVLARIEDLESGYDGRIVLRGLSLEVRAGEVLAILGRNGSGKTTFAKCLDGLLPALAGRVEVGGHDPARLPRPEVARLVGLLFQNPDHQLIASSVQEEVELGPRLAGMPAEKIPAAVARALEITGLQPYARADPFTLPKGLRQKVALASVLAFGPPLIVFDEPTTGLDGPEQVKMMTLLTDLARAGRGIVIITHAAWVAARYASRVVLLAEGRIVAQGSPREVFSDERALAEAGVEPPASVKVSRRVLGCTLLSPAEYAAHVRLGGS
jgi:energy-coupling factor transporter ATP-binding protein EcfA2